MSAEQVNAGQQALIWVLGLGSLLGTVALSILAFFAKSWAENMRLSIDELTKTVAKNRTEFEAKLELTITRVHDRIDAYAENLRENEKACFDERLRLHEAFAKKETLAAHAENLRHTADRVGRLERDVETIKGAK